MTIQGTKPQQQHLALHVHNNSTASSLLTLHIIHNSTRIDAHFLQLHSIWTGVRSNRGKRRLFYCWCPSCHQPQHSLSLPLVIPVITPTFLLLSLQRKSRVNMSFALNWPAAAAPEHVFWEKNLQFLFFRHDTLIALLSTALYLQQPACLPMNWIASRG